MDNYEKEIEIYFEFKDIVYLRMTSKSLMGTKSPLDTGGDMK